MVQLPANHATITDFDCRRAIPDACASDWLASGLWVSATVSQVIDADVDPDAVACVVDDEHVTFGVLRSWSVAVAERLRRQGVTAGDRVVLHLTNSAELLAGIMACWRLGAIAVPVLAMFGTRELTAVMRQTCPSAVIARAGSSAAEVDAALAAAGVVARVRFGVGHVGDGWTDFPGRPVTLRDHVAGLPGFNRPDACVLVLFTSGTTAEPKGVRHDSYSLLAEVNSYRRSAALDKSDVLFNPAPVAHVGALVVSVIVPWVIGSPVVLQSKWNSRQAAELIARHRVTFAVGAPVFLNELVTAYESAAHDAHRVTKFQTGAASTATALLERAEAVGVVAWRAWGMTEAPTLSYGTVGDVLARRAGSDGRIEPGSEVRTVDEHGLPLPPGSEGELVVRSPKQMMGYLDPAHGAFLPGGWMATGDLGVVDADGWVRITGRVKDVVNRGGEKFSCREIEDALSTHPTVDAVAVLGVPEERLGEQVVAFVTVRAGSDFPGFNALVEHLKGRGIALRKHPVEIIVIDALPTTPTGKVLKTSLAQRWRECARA